MTRLTGRGGILLLVCLLTAAVGAFLGEEEVVRLALFGMLLVPVTYPLSRWNVSGLTLSRDLPVSCFVGDVFRMDVKLSNESPFLPRFAIELEDAMSGPTERGLSARIIGPGGTVQRRIQTRMLRRGVRHRIRCALVSEFPLGIWRTSQEFSDHLDFTVFPRPVRPRAFDDPSSAGASDSDEFESDRRDIDGDFHGIREFQPGDRMKMIHWPATARTGGLRVRVFDRPLPQHFCVMYHSISPTKPDGEYVDAFEGALELLSGLIRECRTQQVPFDFQASFHGWKPFAVRTQADMESAFHLLASARRHGERDAGQLVRALAGVGRHSRVFVLSDVPVKEWEPLLPDFPFELNCISVADLRIRRPGRVFRLAPAKGHPPATVP
jgi:uncharacterized protein (DUF58 family)